MNNATHQLTEPDITLEQEMAREAYFRLREDLLLLRSASNPNAAAIDEVIKELEQAQLRYKATHGLIGNNPIGDSPRHG